MKRILALWFLSALILLSAVSAQQQSLPVKVRIADPANGAISGALVIFHSEEREPYTGKYPLRRELRSSSSGEVAVELPSGWYDVFVSVSGFRPTCTQIHLTAPRTIELKLQLGAMYATDSVVRQ